MLGISGKAFVLLAATACLFQVPSAQAADWQTYANDRFGATADVPVDHFSARPRADNDGQIWVSDDGLAEIAVYGALIVDQPNFATYRRAQLRSAEKDGVRISYQDRGSDWFVYSGTHGEDVVYERAVRADHCAALVASHVRLRYPAKQRDRYAPIVKRVAGSLTTSPSAECENRAWIQIASRPTIAEAKDIASQYVDSYPDTKIFQTRNGWYAIVIDSVAPEFLEQSLGNLRSGGYVPDDTLGTYGKSFMTLVWAPDEEDMPRPATPAKVASAEATPRPAVSQPPAHPADESVDLFLHSVVVDSATKSGSSEIQWGFLDRRGKWVIAPRFNDAWPFSEGLAAATSDTKLGFIDKHGEWVIEPRFEAAGSFKDGVAPVKHGGKWGFIDRQGQWVIGAGFDDARSFSDGLASAQIQGRGWGYIDRNGDWVIPPRFFDARSFSDGLAKARTGKREPWGFVDTSGDWAIRPAFDEVGVFDGGLAPAGSKGDWGYIDKSGRWRIKPRLGNAMAFSEGLAAAQGKDHRMWGFIDRNGNWVIDRQFDGVDLGFDNGLARVTANGHFLYVDKKGNRIKSPSAAPPGTAIAKAPSAKKAVPRPAVAASKARPAVTAVAQSNGAAAKSGEGQPRVEIVMAIEPQFDIVENFHEGLAEAAIGKKWGFIDKSGAWVVRPRFEETLSFSEGMAGATLDGRKWGFIDKSGAWVIEPKHNSVRSFTGGLAMAAGDGEFDYDLGYMDKSGQWLIKPQFPDAWAFGDGLARVRHGGTWGIIDKSGAWVFKDQYGDIDNSFHAGWFYEGLALVDRNGKWGYFDRSGSMIIEPRFEDAGVFAEGLAPAKQDGKWGYIDKSGSWVIEPTYDNPIPWTFWSFQDGLARATRDDKEGLIDKSGSWVLDPIYDHVRSPREGFRRVSRGKKWGFVDKSGVMAIEPQFDDAKDFSNGLAPARRDGKWGYIDTSGAWVAEPRYGRASIFVDGLAAVTLNGKWGFLAKRIPGSPETDPRPGAASANAKPPQAAAPDATEVVFWETVRKANNAEMTRAYLDTYPNGHFRPLAEIMLKRQAN